MSATCVRNLLGAFGFLVVLCLVTLGSGVAKADAKSDADAAYAAAQTSQTAACNAIGNAEDEWGDADTHLNSLQTWYGQNFNDPDWSEQTRTQFLESLADAHYWMYEETPNADERKGYANARYGLGDARMGYFWEEYLATPTPDYEDAKSHADAAKVYYDEAKGAAETASQCLASAQSWLNFADGIKNLISQ